MTDFARVFQPIPLRLNYRLISTIRYLQRPFIHKKITPARLACLCFINAFYENKWGLKKNIPKSNIEGYDKHGQDGLWKRICQDPYRVNKTLRRENTLIIHQRGNLLYFIKMTS